MIDQERGRFRGTPRILVTVRRDPQRARLEDVTAENERAHGGDSSDPVRATPTGREASRSRIRHGIPPELAEKIRNHLAGQAGLVEKKMFGGLAFLVHGNMSVGVHGKELIVRINADSSDEALKQRGVRVFDVSGRAMKGWLLVSGPGIKEPLLGELIRRGVSYASSLPRK